MDLSIRLRVRASHGPAFTLVELLVVVAVVAILAAIAVPAFLEAQIRSKISRVHSDFRTLATANEAYFVDHNAYPPNETFYFPLTYPVQYANEVLLLDPFDRNELYFLYTLSEDDPEAANVVGQAFPGNAQAQGDVFDHGFIFSSAGPDRVYLLQAVDGNPNDSVEDADYAAWVAAATQGGVYDPSNGTVSPGDIARTRHGVTRPHLIN